MCLWREGKLNEPINFQGQATKADKLDCKILNQSFFSPVSHYFSQIRQQKSSVLSDQMGTGFIAAITQVLLWAAV